MCVDLRGSAPGMCVCVKPYDRVGDRPCETVPRGSTNSGLPALADECSRSIPHRVLVDVGTNVKMYVASIQRMAAAFKAC